MNLGIFANTFNRSSFIEIFEVIKQHNLSSIEMNLSLLDIPELKGTDTLPSEPLGSASVQQVVKAANTRAIQMDSMAAYFNMIHPDVKERELGLEKLELLMQAAKAMNITLLSLCTGTRDAKHMWRYHPENGTRDAYKDCLASMTRALELAEKNDLTLAFEPEVNLVIHSPKKARKLLDDLKHPRLKIIFDAANIFPEGSLQAMESVLTDAIHLLADDIVLAHAKDLLEDGKAGDVAAGKGKLDYPLYLNLLKEINFEGAVLLHGLNEDEVEDSIRYVQDSFETKS